MTDNLDWTTVEAVNKAIQNYGNALVKLKNLQLESGSYLPKGCINIGLLGEYYAYIWLKHEFPESIVSYGGSTEKSWDIQVANDREIVRYQVKTVCMSSRAFRITNLKVGFDKLVVVLLAEDYFPEDAYLLENNFKFRELQTLTVPSTRGKGSPIFASHGKNVKIEFFDSLSIRL